jgi:hypothetical protein
MQYLLIIFNLTGYIDDGSVTVQPPLGEVNIIRHRANLDKIIVFLLKYTKNSV